MESSVVAAIESDKEARGDADADRLEGLVKALVHRLLIDCAESETSNRNVETSAVSSRFEDPTSEQLFDAESPEDTVFALAKGVEEVPKSLRLLREMREAL